MNRNKAYPLYETTVFRDFRVMVEQSAENFPDKPAISYKKNPRDKETMSVTYAESRDNIRNLGFGAGMGFPNMKKYTDYLNVNTVVGEGTTVTMKVYL